MKQQTKSIIAISLVLALALAFMVSFTACNPDGSGGQSGDVHPIVGVWIAEDADDSGWYSGYIFFDSGVYINRWNFTRDKHAPDFYFESSISARDYLIHGNQLFLNGDLLTFSISGNKLTLTYWSTNMVYVKVK